MKILSNPLCLVDWAGAPPSQADWETLEADLSLRLDIVRRLLPLPFPLGAERHIGWAGDAHWLEAQYTQLVGLLGSVRERPLPVMGGTQTYGRAVLWCAAFDREHRRRRRIARGLRALVVMGTVLLFAVGLSGYQQLTGASDISDLGRFLGAVAVPLMGGWTWLLDVASFLPGMKSLSGAALRDAVGLFVLGGGISFALGSLLRSRHWATIPWVRLTRLLIWSNLTILAVLSSGAMGGIEWAESGKTLPDMIGMYIHPKQFCFFVGYFIPIALFGGTVWHIFKPPGVSATGIWRRVWRGLAAFKAEMFPVSPTAASPPETPQQSAPP